MPLLEAQIIEKAKAHLQEKLGERKVETKGEYVQFQSPRFQELIGFIQGHPDDHPGNATMQPEDVKHIVTLTPEGDSGAVVAMNDQYELLGFAD